MIDPKTATHEEVVAEVQRELTKFIGRPREAFRRPPIGSEIHPGAIVTGPKRLPRKLKKEQKKKGIMFLTVSVQPILPPFIVVTLGFDKPKDEP